METLTTFLIAISGLLTGYLIIALPQSFYSPGVRKIQAIMFFGRLSKIIANVEGKKVYKGENIPGGLTKWDIIDLSPNEKRRLNVYFFLWPFFKLHTYPFTYIKEKMIGEEQEGDIVVWKDEDAKRCLVSRTGTSNHLEWRVEYPTVTSNLDTEELAAVNTYTNNMIEVRNPAKTFFGIKNWLETTNEVLHGGLRGLVASKKLHDLNQFSSEDKNGFNKIMMEHANTDTEEQRGLPTIGLYLFKSVFKDFNPANDTAKALMKSYSEVEIAKQTGQAKFELAKKDVEVAKEKAKAYEAEQEKIVMWRKKFLVDTGLAKIDTEGNIIELVPDANTKISAESLKELSKLKGTLVLDSGSLNKIFSITPTKKEE